MNRRGVLLGMAGLLVVACLSLVIYAFQADRAGAEESAAPRTPHQASPTTAAPLVTADPIESVDKIAAALDAQGEWRFTQTPLPDVIEFVRSSAKIDLVINTWALEDAGVPTNTPITCDLHGISLRSFFGIVLEPIGLALDRRDGAIWITTKEEARSRLSTRVYPVADLVRVRDEFGQTAYDLDELIGVIWGHLAPDSWNGPGAIEGIYSSLVVLQTQDVHEKLSRFLTALRQVSRQTQENPDGPGKPVFIDNPAAHARILAALDERITLDVKDSPLSEVANFLSQSTSLPIVLDTPPFADFGIDPHIVVTARAEDVPLRFVLRRLLDPLDLTYVVRDEVLTITTPEASEDNWQVCIYPVRNLVAPCADASVEEYDFDPLIEVLTSCVAPDSWDEGKGPQQTLANPPVLVISQTERNHEQLREVLGQLWQAKQVEREVRRVLPEENTRVFVRTYAMNPGHKAKEVLPLILKLLGDDILAGEGVLIEVLGNDLIVRHTQRGHQRIAALLFRLWRPPPPVGGTFPGNSGDLAGGGGQFCSPPASTLE